MNGILALFDLPLPPISSKIVLFQQLSNLWPQHEFEGINLARLKQLHRLLRVKVDIFGGCLRRCVVSQTSIIIGGFRIKPKKFKAHSNHGINTKRD